MKKVIDILYTCVIVAAVLIFVYALARIFFVDSFVVRGQSMEPTLNDGQRIFVNKLAMGARIYTRFDFESPELKCFRMPGLKPLQPGDIAVFNYPFGWEKGKIGFKINYVYAKRCIGCPGDYVGIQNGHYKNGRNPSKLLGDEKMQDMLYQTPDSTLLNQGVTLKAYRHKYTGWTIKEFGPLRVPCKGLAMIIDSTALKIYSNIIEYETGNKATIGPYIFKEDYYFFCGDNVFDSRDCRYFGFVPERFVIGKVIKNAKGRISYTDSY